MPVLWWALVGDQGLRGRTPNRAQTGFPNSSQVLARAGTSRPLLGRVHHACSLEEAHFRSCLSPFQLPRPLGRRVNRVAPCKAGCLARLTPSSPPPPIFLKGTEAKPGRQLQWSPDAPGPAYKGAAARGARLAGRRNPGVGLGSGPTGAQASQPALFQIPDSHMHPCHGGGWIWNCPLPPARPPRGKRRTRLGGGQAVLGCCCPAHLVTLPALPARLRGFSP